MHFDPYCHDTIEDTRHLQFAARYMYYFVAKLDEATDHVERCEQEPRFRDSEPKMLIVGVNRPVNLHDLDNGTSHVKAVTKFIPGASRVFAMSTAPLRQAAERTTPIRHTPIILRRSFPSG